MRRSLVFVLCVTFGGIAACTSDAPLAPRGLHRRPANLPQTLAETSATGEHTPADDAHTSASRTPAAMPTPVFKPVVGPPYVISDFNAPDGIRGLPEEEREKLVEAARGSMSVIIFVRGDAIRPNRAVWNRLAQRGGEVRQYLIGQGVAPARIRLFVRSAGAFVADNATVEGRARNRRVEIHMDEVKHGQRS